MLVQGSALLTSAAFPSQAGQTDSGRAERALLFVLHALALALPPLSYQHPLLHSSLFLRRHRSFFLFVFDIHAVLWRCYDTRTPAHCSCWGEEQGRKKHKLAGVSGTDSVLLMYNGRTTGLWDGISPTPSTVSQNLVLCRFKLRFNVLLLFLLERYGQNKPIFHNATFVFSPYVFTF